MIQSVGAPHLVYEIRDFQNATYTVASPNPDDDWTELAKQEGDQYFVKNAREFKRQEVKFSAVPPEPEFDEDGLPTFEEDC